MKLTPVYVVTDSEGRAELEVEGLLDQTVEAALSAYGKHTPIVFAGDLEQMKREESEGRGHGTREQARLANPPLALGAFETAAMRALGPNFWQRREGGAPETPRTYSRDEVEGEFPMTDEGLRAAWQALRPYFPKKGDFSRIIKNGPNAGQSLLIGDTYETPAGMSRAFLVANAKTLKAVGGIEQREEGYEGIEATVNGSISPSLSKGLAFLPHALVKNTEFYPQWGGVPELRSKVGVCVGSSDACRTSCLIYAGQNQAVEHNNLIKGDRLLGLLKEPKAFIRMMVDSMEKHVRATAKTGTVPYFRPNILSDIPWEILFPELWTYPAFQNLSIYDYTKLAGRETASLGRLHSAMGADKMLDGALRYDLTFSFSGENANLMEQELERGVRLAIVFLRTLKSGSLKPNKDTGKVSYKAAESFGNMRFLGKRIIDGDEHDLRPLDPQGTIVGLRFKSLRGKQSGTRAEQIERAGKFVVGSSGKLPKHREKKHVALHVQNREIKWVVEGFDDGHGNLLAPATPLQEGVALETLYDLG